MDWDWNYALQIMPALAAGVVVTIQVTLLGSALAMMLGLAVAISLRTAPRGLARLLRFVMEFIRGTPLLVQLYFLFYVLPDIGINLSPLVCGVLALGLHYSSYTAEVYRAGIESVLKGQWEAAKALNLNRLQSWRYVIVPQAIPPMIPALANYFVAMFKETPLLSTITVVELMSQARILANFNYRYLEPMTLVGLFFLAVSIPSVIILRKLERKFGTGSERRTF
jgi:polar amino acid transport system permease protein